MKRKDCPLCDESKMDKFYDSPYCFAVLALEQYTTGHTIIVTKDHYVDISDDLPIFLVCDFMDMISEISSLLKGVVKNEKGESPEKIYVTILCDGVEHLHAHLIPRYPWTKLDEIDYHYNYEDRDKHEVLNSIARGDMGGVWYIVERSRKPYKRSKIDRKQLTEELRNEISSDNSD